MENDEFKGLQKILGLARMMAISGLRSSLSSLSALAVLALASPAWANTTDVQPGDWEFNITMRVPSAPDFAPPPQVLVKCLATGATPASVMEGLPTGGAAANCTYVSKETVGSTFRFVLQCPGKPPLPTIESTGEIRMALDSVQGEIKMVTTLGVSSSEVISKLTAKRIGPCKRF